MTMWKSDKLQLLPIADTRKRFFVRISGDADVMKAYLDSRFGPVSTHKGRKPGGRVRIFDRGNDRGHL